MKRTKCEECGGKIEHKKQDFFMYGELVGRFFAEHCKKCNEVVFDESVVEKIDEAIKSKGLWGLESKSKVGVVGNSLDVKISKRIAEFVDLRKGADVRIHPESKKRLVIDIL